jgi:NAD+ synthase (glutamine-hydrolysing)
MKSVNVAAACLNQTPLDWENNTKNIISAIKDAESLGITILCLPELCITGYGCEDAFFANYVHEKAIKYLELIRYSVPDNMIVSVGLPLVHNNAIYNVAAIIVGQKVLGFVPKQHLCSDGIHYESRWFKPWPTGIVSKTYVRGVCDLIGDLVFNIGGIKIGFEICEDAWVADRPGVKLAERAVDIILNPSASHFAFGKHDIRKRFVSEGSRAFKAVYIYSNLLGNESGRVIFDGDTIIASGGKVIAEGRRLSFLNYLLTPATVDIGSNRVLQLQNGSFMPVIESNEIFEEFDYTINPERINYFANRSFGIGSDAPKELEFRYAVALGLYDYMRKSHSNGFVVSLSGGADSSAVSCLVRSMYDIARSELGDDILPDMKQLLTCVYQSTENSSDTTKHAAITLAGAIGAEFIMLDVDGIVSSYRSMIESAFDRKLSWDTDDVALQNIQARVRAPSAWMIANIKNALLLCTSNRSEAAVGYCSIDGDTCGGIAPIGGIDKSFLLSWLRWMSSRAMYQYALEPVLSMVPTAELRPQEAAQSDEKDLMPYDVLNEIEGLAIRDKLSPEEIVSRLSGGDEDIAIISNWVNKFFKLWTRNQWKREKLPLAFHLDDHNLDPKTWCRFPVLSGSVV